MYTRNKLELITQCIVSISVPTSTTSARESSITVLESIKPSELIDICIQLLKHDFESWADKRIMVFGILFYWIDAIVKTESLDPVKKLQTYLEDSILSQSNALTGLLLSDPALRSKFQQLLGYMLALIRPNDWRGLKAVSETYYANLSPTSVPVFGSFFVGTLLELCQQLVVQPADNKKTLWQQHKINISQRSNIIHDIGKYIEVVFSTLDQQLAITHESDSLLDKIPTLAVTYLEVLSSLQKINTLKNTPSLNFSFFSNPRFYSWRSRSNSCNALQSLTDILCRQRNKRKGEFEYMSISNFKQLLGNIINNIFIIFSGVINDTNTESVEKAQTVLPLAVALAHVIKHTNQDVWGPNLNTILSLLSYLLAHPFLEFPSVAIECFISIFNKLSVDNKKKTLTLTDLWSNPHAQASLTTMLCQFYRANTFRNEPVEKLLLNYSIGITNSVNYPPAVDSTKLWSENVSEFMEQLCMENNPEDYLRRTHLSIIQGFTDLLVQIVRNDSKEVLESVIGVVNTFVVQVTNSMDKEPGPKGFAHVSPVMQLLLQVAQVFAKAHEAAIDKGDAVKRKSIEMFIFMLAGFLTSTTLTELDVALDSVEPNSDGFTEISTRNLKYDNYSCMREFKRLEIYKIIAAHMNVTDTFGAEYADYRLALTKYCLKRLMVNVKDANPNSFNDQASNNMFATCKKYGEIVKNLFSSSSDGGLSTVRSKESEEIVSYLLANISNSGSRYPIFLDIIVSIITSLGTYEVINRTIQHYLGDIVTANMTLLQSEFRDANQILSYLQSSKRSTISVDLNNQFDCIENLCSCVNIPSNIDLAIQSGFLSRLKAHELPNISACDIVLNHPLAQFCQTYLPLIMKYVFQYFEVFVAQTPGSEIYRALHFIGEAAIHNVCVRSKRNANEALKSLKALPVFSFLTPELLSLNKCMRLELTKAVTVASTVFRLCISNGIVPLEFINSILEQIRLILLNPHVPSYAKSLLVDIMLKQGIISHMEPSKLPANSEIIHTSSPQTTAYLPTDANVELGFRIIDLVTNYLADAMSISLTIAYAGYLATENLASGDVQLVIHECYEGQVDSLLNAYFTLVNKILSASPNAPDSNASVKGSDLKTIQYARTVYHNKIMLRLFDPANYTAQKLVLAALKLTRFPLPTVTTYTHVFVKSYLRILAKRIIPRMKTYDEAAVALYLQGLHHVLELCVSTALYRQDPILTVADAAKALDDQPAAMNAFGHRQADTCTSREKYHIIAQNIVAGKSPFFVVFTPNKGTLASGTIANNMAQLLLDIYKCANTVFTHFVALRLNREYLEGATILREIPKYPNYKSALLFFHNNHFSLPYSIPTERLVDMSRDLSNENDTPVLNLAIEFVTENLKCLIG